MQISRRNTKIRDEGGEEVPCKRAEIPDRGWQWERKQQVESTSHTNSDHEAHHAACCLSGGI